MACLAKSKSFFVLVFGLTNISCVKPMLGGEYLLGAIAGLALACDGPTRRETPPTQVFREKRRLTVADLKITDLTDVDEVRYAETRLFFTSAGGRLRRRETMWEALPRVFDLTTLPAECLLAAFTYMIFFSAEAITTKTDPIAPHAIRVLRERFIFDAADSKDDLTRRQALNRFLETYKLANREYGTPARS